MTAHRNVLTVFAWCGIAAPVLRLGLILVLGHLHPGYSQTTDFISELSARGAPYAPIMTVAGLYVVGACLTMFSLALRAVLGPGNVNAAGSLLLAASGLAFIAVGLFPCDAGCSMAALSPTMQMHLVAGMTAMTLQTLAPVAFGIGLLAGSAHQGHARFSLVLGGIALCALVILFFGKSLGLPFPALAQKIFQFSTDIWVLGSAVYLLRRMGSAAQGWDREVARG